MAGDVCIIWWKEPPKGWKSLWLVWRNSLPCISCLARLASVFVKGGEGGRGTSFPPPGILGKHASSFRFHRNGFVSNELWTEGLFSHLSALFQSRLVENRKPFGARATFFLSQTKNQSQPNDFSFGWDWFFILRRFFCPFQSVENQCYAECDFFVWNPYIPYPLRGVCPAGVPVSFRGENESRQKGIVDPLPAISFSYGVFFDEVP